MTFTANGRATSARPPINLGDFFPEQREVTVNGRKYAGWVVTNDAYPRRVMAMLDRARTRYLKIVGSLLPEAMTESDLAGLSEEERARWQAIQAKAVEDAEPAYQEYLTSAILALVPDMDESTAELIPPEKAIELVQDVLGYRVRGDGSTSQDESTDGEVADKEPVPLRIGGTTQDDSVTITQPTTINDS